MKRMFKYGLVALVTMSLLLVSCTEPVPPEAQVTAELVTSEELHGELRVYKDEQEVMRVTELPLETNDGWTVHISVEGFPGTAIITAQWEEEEETIAGSISLTQAELAAAEEGEIYSRVMAIGTRVLVTGTVDPTEPLADQQIYQDWEMVKDDPEVLEFVAAFDALEIEERLSEIVWDMAESYGFLEGHSGYIFENIYQGTEFDVPLIPPELPVQDQNRDRIASAVAVLLADSFGPGWSLLVYLINEALLRT